MAYIKSFNGSIILKIENDHISEFSGQIKYKINAIEARREKMALIAIIYAN